MKQVISKAYVTRQRRHPQSHSTSVHIGRVLKVLESHGVFQLLVPTFAHLELSIIIVVVSFSHICWPTGKDIEHTETENNSNKPGTE